MKPEIQIDKETLIFKKGMMINCTLKKGFPVNYTWYSCHKECDKDTKWNIQSHNYSLRIDNQEKMLMNYKCKARNTAGTDESPTIVIVNQDNYEKKLTSSTEKLMFVVIPIGIITVIILVITCFVLYKRKKMYGGFYLFSYPPLPDYLARLDMNENIQEQLQKLPFIPEWEFPRDKLNFSK